MKIQLDLAYVVHYVLNVQDQPLINVLNVSHQIFFREVHVSDLVIQHVLPALAPIMANVLLANLQIIFKTTHVVELINMARMDNVNLVLVLV